MRSIEVAHGGSDEPARAGAHPTAILRLPRISATLRRLILPAVWGLPLLVLGVLCLQLAGYRFVHAEGHSMEPASSAGSLLIARQTPAERIRRGDFIVFAEPYGGGGLTAHRVQALYKSGSRTMAITKGDANGVADPFPIALDSPVSRVVLGIPHLGWWVDHGLRWLELAGVAGLVVALATGQRAHIARFGAILTRGARAGAG